VIIPKLYDGRNKTFFFFNLETGDLLNGCSRNRLMFPQMRCVPAILTS
jgi:hypothetical protein